MIDAVHRPLKASLMCHAETPWIDALPWVLLGMSTAVKEDIGLSSIHLVYREPLRIPGEFLQQTPEVPTNETLQNLQSFHRVLRPQPASRHGSKATFVHKDLNTVPFVLLRQDAVTPALTPPYTGPHRVLDRADKTMKIDVNGHPTVVSMDRLKPAYTTTDPSSQPITPATAARPSGSTPGPSTPPLQSTRSGRRVRFPDFYQAAPTSVSP